MINLQFLRENPDVVRESILRRGMKVDLDRWLVLDARRAELIPEVEAARSKFKLKGKPNPEELEALQIAKTQLAEHEEELSYVEAEWQRLLEDLPNIRTTHSEASQSAAAS
jgi:seryl-tRNA synthetase